VSTHKANDHSSHPESYQSLRTKALESLLIEKGLVSSDAIDAVIESYQEHVGPLNGAKVVAKAWSDPSYRERLLADGTDAIAELGYMGLEGSEIVVVENTTSTHNAVVCTLCSCYPWPVLGLPPSWYKSNAYRSRMVLEPRAVLQEFGLALPETIEIRVWDSTAAIRYMVLPERPPHTELLGEAELVQLVTRDSMIGVAKATEPKQKAADE
jgi:nitrile hydratase